MAREPSAALKRRRGRHGARDGPRRLGGDRAGQMMLLTAIILIIGFFALSGIVVRVQQVGSQTANISDNAVIQEAPQIGRYADRAIEALKDNHTDPDTPEFREDLNSTLHHLVLLERQRGYRLWYGLDCDGGEGKAEFELHDRATRVTFRSEASFDWSTGC